MYILYVVGNYTVDCCGIMYVFAGFCLHQQLLCTYLYSGSLCMYVYTGMYFFTPYISKGILYISAPVSMHMTILMQDI